LFPDINNLIVWVKNNFGLGSGYRPQHELIIFQGKIESNSESNVWNISKDSANSYNHPTQKPVELIEKAFVNSTKSDDLIFDPFLGSAPSIIAAQKMEGNRTVYGFELSPAYCEIILQRFSKLTEIEPKLIGRLPD
jgi:DNA modification methylase